MLAPSGVPGYELVLFVGALPTIHLVSATFFWLHHLPLAELPTVKMVSVQISAAKSGPLTRKLPESVSFDKPLDEITILDVKKAIAAKNPKASSCCC